MKKNIHVLVGSGLPHYFTNALKSILYNTEDDVFAVYNEISPHDRPDLAALTKKNKHRVTIVTRPNETGSGGKTGGLYRAYNDAIEFASGKYHLIHFMQGDMQLMKWEPETWAEISQAFSNNPAAQSGSEKVFCVAPFSLCKGKFGDEFVQSNFDFELRTGMWKWKGRAMVDAGVYSLELIESLGFRFDGTEDDLDSKLSRLGFRLRLTARPSTAFLPWPAVVRNGQVRGVEPRLEGQFQFLLGLKNLSKQSPNRAARKSKSEIVFTEDFVEPNGWSCFYPYWPSDVNSFRILLHRARVCRQERISFWSVTGARTTTTFEGFFWSDVLARHGRALVWDAVILGLLTPFRLVKKGARKILRIFFLR